MDDFARLARSTGESAADWGLRLLDHLSARHQRAERVLIETYLEQLPGLATEQEVVLDLLVAEWTLRQQAGESVGLSDYVQRFPQWEQDLRLLWEVDQHTLPPVRHASALAVGAALPAWYIGPAKFPVVFGAYRLLREAGSGGMARVFQAEPLVGGQAVALKVPRLPVGHDANAAADARSRRQRFLREASLTEQLHHPRLCRALEVGECAGLPYYTMPFYPHGSVGDQLQEGRPFDEKPAARLIAEVARALQHAHDQGIIHRDLKPSNLLRDAQGRVIVSDFGLAFATDEEALRFTHTGDILGTLPYLSPEQAEGKRDLTPASDIFSLGVVLFELLSGRRPFVGNGFEVLKAIQAACPTPLEQVRPEVAPALAAICRRALGREPKDRYPSMDAFADDLERFLAGSWTPLVEQAEWPPTTTDEAPPARRSRTRWRRVGFGVAAAVLLGALALWALVGRSGSPSTAPEGERRPPPGSERPIVSTRQPIGLRGQLQLLHDDLAKVDAPARPHLRYLSLLAVHDNPYISNAEFDLHREALQIVLNRLSWEKPKVPTQRVDASGCLVRIDLRDLGWEASKEWALLLRVEPYGVRYDEVNPDAALRKLAGDIDNLTDFNVPCVRADWLIAAATCAPLFDQLQHLEGHERRTPPFDLTDSKHPVAQVVQLYQANAVDAHVAAAELGLGTVAELDARWPADKPELRQALDQLVPRSRWAGENGPGGFEEYVRTLKLGVPRAIQPIH